MSFIALHRALLACGVIGAVVLGVAAATVDAGIALAGALPLSFFVAGTVAFTSRPTNTAARRLMAFGALHLAGLAIPATLLATGSTSEPWAWAANLLSTLCFTGGFASFTAMLAVFPDGLYHRRFELLSVRTVTAAAVVMPPLAALGMRRQPLVLDLPGRQLSTTAPVHVEQLAQVGSATMALALSPLIGLALLVRRYGAAGADQRRQMRWPLGAVALLMLAILTTPVVEGMIGTTGQAVVFLVAAGTLPVALVVGMLRHQLLDVDLVIRRSLAYVVLWLGIALLYAGLAVLPGIAVGRNFPMSAAVLTTIAIAMAFQPLRRRLENATGRLLFGHQGDAIAVVSDFGRTLQRVFSLDELKATVADVVKAGIDAEWVRVELREPSSSQPAPALAAPLEHAGVLMGRIACGPRRQGRYGQSDEELLIALARQAALAFRNAMLADNLARKLRALDERTQELAASRRRIVEAADKERRRIERDLHDGIQQEMIALMAGIELARADLGRGDSAAAESALLELAGQLRETHRSVRELAQGIHPGVLSDRGLHEALASRAARLPVTVALDVDDAVRGRRFPPELEGAAYFVACEALANIVKHSGAAHASLRLAAPAATLVIEVSDDGEGCDPAALEAGSGIQGLRDRVDAIGGQLVVQTLDGSGVHLRAMMPISGSFDAHPAALSGAGSTS